MNEYSVDWPLWDSNGPCGEGVPPLPPKLTAEIVAWARDFNSDYDVEAGWPTASAARFHERQGRRLLELIARELPSEDDVVLEYWETSSRTGL